MNITLIFLIFIVGCCISLINSQVAPKEEIVAQVEFDTGYVSSETEAIVLSKQIYVPDVDWIRIKFDEAVLSKGAYVRITALDDGDEQHLDHITMFQWSKTSAYFNGDELLVELIVPEHVYQPSRIKISQVWAGPTPLNNRNNTIRTICGPTDKRVRSNYAPDARLVGGGYCSAWLTNHGHTSNRCFLTAGHCSPSGSGVVQFNVPDSSSGGSVRQPAASDQYAIQGESVQSVNGGTGNDWGVFGVHRNSETGQSASGKQQNVYVLDASVGNVGVQARICGYGSASGAMNLVQKVHSNSLVSRTSTRVTYQTDTTGGNSGSAVSVSTGSTSWTAYGIHTHGGCTSSGSGTNSGTWLGVSGLQNALSNPKGICVTG